MSPSPGSRSHRRDLLTGAALVVGVALAVTAASAAGLGATAIRAVGDVLWPSGSADPRAVVVAIDQASLDREGDWPWSRVQQAELLQAVLDAGAASVALDVALVGESDAEGDRAIRSVLDGAPVVLVDPLDQVSAGPRWPVAGERLPLDRAAVPASTALGHSLVGADPDGVTRTIAAIVESPDGILVPSLSLQAVAVANGGATELRVATDRVIAGTLVVPLEAGSRARIGWADDLRVESAGDVLDGGVELDGAVVVIGVTASGLGDRHATPIGGDLPGAIVHAAEIDTLLRAAWTAPAPPWGAGLAALLGAAVVVPPALRRRLRWLPLAVAGVAAAIVAVGFVLFDTAGVLPDLVRPMVGVVAAAGLAIGVRAVREQRDRRRVDTLFGRYVPDHVAERLLADGRVRPPDDERIDVAVLFCDIRGFTPIAELADPGVVRASLDAFYDFVCDEVFARDGTVMQFVGDEVFAVFGAPVAQADAPQRAMAAALALQSAAEALGARLADDGLPPLEFGIGVHAGPVVAAHVGPERRRQYAVIGDTVNVGSRLCGLALAGQLVSSVEVDDWPLDVDVERERAEVKGHRTALDIVRVIRSGSADVPAQRVAVGDDDAAPLERDQPAALE